MKSNAEPSADILRLVRFSALLWIGYMIALVIINLFLGPPQPINWLYYLLNGLVALVCLAFTWKNLSSRIKSALVPLFIGICTFLPILINWWITRVSGPTLQFAPGSSVLNIFPFLFIGLLVTAWQYRWPQILLVILAITALNLAFTWYSAPPRSGPFQGALNVALIQTVIFLAVAFSASYLVSRLRRQQRSLEEANQNLANYAATLEQLSTSRERNRLAREMHDTLAHTLSALSVQLETIKAYWEVDREAARALLQQSSGAAHSGLEETRRALKALRASPLEDLGLPLALDSLARDAAARTGLRLTLTIADGLPSLAPGVEQGVYRVAQEAIANAVNHARASSLKVSLQSAGDSLILIVEDDGKGFDVEKSAANHFGLTGMRERAQLLGGSLEISSNSGAGSRVILAIPLR